jgi:hypothetical protein
MATTKREHAAVRPPAVIDPDLDPDAFWDGAETFDLAADEELWDRDDLEDLDGEDEWMDLDTEDGDLFDPLDDAGDDEDEPTAARRRRRR